MLDVVIFYANENDSLSQLRSRGHVIWGSLTFFIVGVPGLIHAAANVFKGKMDFEVGGRHYPISMRNIELVPFYVLAMMVLGPMIPVIR